MLKVVSVDGKMPGLYFQKGAIFIRITVGSWGKNFLIFGVEATAVLFDDEGNTVRLHHMNGILGTESMQKGALESTFHIWKK